jgi:N-acetylglutamate synthase-like GNAT family acetyltransferase
MPKGLVTMAASRLKGNSLAVEIRHDIQPGDIGYIIYLHGKLYAEEYGFDHTFEPYVAGPMAEFVKSQTVKDRLWIVEKDKQIMGSIAIVKSSEHEAQLRWLILHPDIRGFGIGKKLVEEAVAFSKESAYGSIFLWTLDILPSALWLYKSAGFQLTEKKKHRIWGRMLTEERYDLKLK